MIASNKLRNSLSKHTKSTSTYYLHTCGDDIASWYLIVDLAFTVFCCCAFFVFDWKETFDSIKENNVRTHSHSLSLGLIKYKNEKRNKKKNRVKSSVQCSLEQFIAHNFLYHLIWLPKCSYHEIIFATIETNEKKKKKTN